MKEKILCLKDIHKTRDYLSFGQIFSDRGGPKKTKIIIRDADTGELLSENENKVVIQGALKASTKLFGITPSVHFPTYNEEMELENSLDPTDKPRIDEVVSLFCIDDSGCGSTKKDLYTTDFIDRISPDTIMPFRYVDIEKDLNEDLRKYYFGRKVIGNKVAYYFKKFEADPVLHLRYTDGTQVTEDVYNYQSTQPADVYIETKMKINRNDFRDYFEEVLGWDKARVSSLSLCTAYYDDTLDGEYKWYQNIAPYTKLNFPYEELVSLDRAIMIYYQIYY